MWNSSFCHPMWQQGSLEAGIIRSFKTHNSCHLAFTTSIVWTIDSLSRLTCVLTVCMAKRAWDAVSPETISYCWKHVGLFFDSEEPIVLGKASRKTKLSWLRWKMLLLICRGVTFLSSIRQHWQRPKAMTEGWGKGACASGRGGRWRTFSSDLSFRSAPEVSRHSASAGGKSSTCYAWWANFEHHERV